MCPALAFHELRKLLRIRMQSSQHPDCLGVSTGETESIWTVDTDVLSWTCQIATRSLEFPKVLPVGRGCCSHLFGAMMQSLWFKKSKNNPKQTKPPAHKKPHKSPQNKPIVRNQQNPNEQNPQNERIWTNTKWIINKSNKKTPHNKTAEPQNLRGVPVCRWDMGTEQLYPAPRDDGVPFVQLTWTWLRDSSLGRAAFCAVKLFIYTSLSA